MSAYSANDKLLLERIQRRTTGASDKLRTAALALAQAVIEDCPAELERASALQHLEEVLLWTKAGSP